MTTAMAPLWPTHPRLNARFSAQDTTTMEEEFAQEEKVLFLQEEEIDEDEAGMESDEEEEFNVAIIEFQDNTVVRRSLKSVDDVNSYIEEPLLPNSTRILLIHQLFSLGAFEISATALRRLFTHLSLKNSFWTTMRKFVKKKGEDRESCGGFQACSISEDGSIAFTYNVKLSALHGENRKYSPWTLRQMAAHHQYSAQEHSHTFVLLNPSDELAKHFSRISAAVEFDATAIQLSILATATEPWDNFLSYQELCFKELAKKAKLSTDSTNTTSRQICFDVEQSDAQAILGVQDTLLATIHMLELNLSIFPELIKLLPLLCKDSTEPPNGLGLQNVHQTALSTLATQTQVRRGRAKSLLKRLDGVAALVRSILDAQALFAIEASSRLTNELATLARGDAEKTTQDARRLNTITIMGLIYLPASFVATLLGTQFIKLGHDENGQVTIIMAGEMVIFVVLTVIMLALTFGCWVAWEKWDKIKTTLRGGLNGLRREKNSSVV